MTPHELNIENWKHLVVSTAVGTVDSIEADCLEQSIIPLTDDQKEIVLRNLCATIAGSMHAVMERTSSDLQKQALAELCGVK